MYQLKIVFILISLFCGGVLAVDRPVLTPVGTIVGKTENVTYGENDQYSGEITKFLGIPYAEPPTGDRRFARPVPKPNFNNPFSAFQFGPMCPQANVQESLTDEDCLSLNIYTPDTTGTASNVSVIIFVHGGAYVNGAGQLYEAEKIVAYSNVVVVTINYRLGVLGFLDTGDGAVPANNGLMDQHVAIRWVNKNIGSFGGNPNMVTIMGESAGSSSVIFQSLYPQNDGLFQRIIAQSGTPTNDWATVKLPIPNALQLAMVLGCSKSNSTLMAQCLKDYGNVTELIRKSLEVGDPTRINWGPTVDEVFVSKDHLKELQNPTGKVDMPLFQKVDLLMGTNGFEGFAVLTSFFPDYINPNISVDQLKQMNDQTFAAFLTVFAESRELAEVTKLVKEQYKITDVNNTNLYYKQVIDFLNDIIFVSQTATTIQRHNHGNQNSKTYQYEFNERFPSSQLPTWVTGAIHGSELGYIFGFPETLAPFYGGYTQDQVKAIWPFVSKMVDHWTNFAKTGNPNTATSNWKEYTPDDKDYYYLTSSLQEGRKSLYGARMNFWNRELPNFLAERSVKTSVGLIVGREEMVDFGGESTSMSSKIIKFLGIPYAEPPTGNQRFARPVPKAIFDAPFKAFQFASPCPQEGRRTQSYNEDCLHLNIYTPVDINSDKKLPVMVFIPGGSWILGDGKYYGAEKLAAYGKVVVVTFNYRLGPLGFLTINNGEIPANNGLMDQHLAIKWVHFNIASFGGDPSMVTLFGQQAGAASAIFQSMYSKNTGLFHRIIAQSGTAVSPWATVRNPIDNARKLALKLNCPVTNTKEMVRCLRSYSDVSELIAKSKLSDINTIVSWGPTVDGKILKKEQLQELKSPTGNVDLSMFRNLDLLTGSNGFEGVSFRVPSFRAYMNKTATIQDLKNANRETAVMKLGDHYNKQIVDGIIHAVDFQYTNYEHPNNRDQHTLQSLAFLEDLWISLPIYTTLQAHSHTNTMSRTFQYQFNELYPNIELPELIKGAIFGMELGYIFGFSEGIVQGNYLYPGVTVEFVKKSWPFTAKMMDLWTNFAKTGNPSTNWKPYTPDNRDYYYLTSRQQEGRNHLHAERMQFWNSYLPLIMKQIDNSASPPENKPCPVSSAVNVRFWSVGILVTIFSFFW